MESQGLLGENHVSVKEQMLKARSLIQQKRYDEARGILRQVNHPKAKEWLQKLDKIAPPGKAAKPRNKASSTPAPSRAQPAANAKRKRRSRGPVIAVLGVLLVVMLIVAGLLFLPGLLRSEPQQDTGAVADAQNGESTPESAANTDEDAASSGSGSVVGSGERIPMVDAARLYYVELPQGWLCDCRAGAGRFETTDEREGTVAVSLAQQGFDADYFIDKSLEEAIASEVRDDEVIAAQDTVPFNGREVVVVTVEDEDGDQEIRYFVRDSSGRVIVLEIPGYVDEPDALRQDVLFIAGNIESESQEASNEFAVRLTETLYGYDSASNTWYVADVRGGREQVLELPPDWAIASGNVGFPLAEKFGSAQTSATAIVFLVRNADAERPLAEIAAPHANPTQGTLQSEETLESNGREVYRTTAQDDSSGNITVTYYVLDSDNDLVALIIQPFVDDPDALHDDVLFMAGNVESVPITWDEQIARAGLTDGTSMADDQGAEADITQQDTPPPAGCTPTTPRHDTTGVEDFAATGFGVASYSESTGLWRTEGKDQIRRILTLELPTGWVLNNRANAVIEGAEATTEVSFNYLVGTDAQLPAIPAELAALYGDVIATTESVEQNGRTIIVVTYETSTKVDYFTQDSNCNLVFFQVPATVEDPAALHDDVLFMASNVEVTRQ